MKGLHIIKSDGCIDKSGNPNCTYELKALDDGLEVMIMTLKAESLLICQPYECKGTPNIYYILEGTLQCQKDGILLNKGDCISVKDIEASAFFNVLEEARLLWIIGKNIFDEVTYENKAIEEILNTIQIKDLYTHDHCQRVGRLSRQIARRMGLTDKRIVNTIIAAMCHDVGKVNIPTEILNKPDKLTDEEYEKIKLHSKAGFDIVRRELDESIAAIVEQHHERLDGRGYPCGRSGNDIIMEAKILAVVDSYDAMISDRVYKRGISPAEALAELRRCVGTHYEKEIVDKFEQVLYEEGILD